MGGNPTLTAEPATIFALSSGALPAGIAVVRISGPDTRAGLQRLVGRLPEPRMARLRAVRDAQNHLIDRALILWMPGPHTVTGEDLAEIHCHGSRAVVQALIRELEGWPGWRLADPGEFTRRAFEQGRIDLIEAEGLADLLTARTESQRRAAQALCDGGLSRAVGGWQSRLIGLSARIEAALDFSDEDDVDLPSVESFQAEMRDLADGLGSILAAPPAERLHEGVRVVLAGPPNAGKSTLLNALAGRDAALVSPIAGTTRDLIEVPLVLADFPILLIDMAGLRDATEDPVEAAGIVRARSALAMADLILLLGDETLPLPDNVPVLPIVTKADLLVDEPCTATIGIRVSAHTGQGMADLRSRLVAMVAELSGADHPFLLRTRQRAALQDAQTALSADLPRADLLLLADHVRQALAAFDRLTGRAGIEQVLDALFSGFCIGK